MDLDEKDRYTSTWNLYEGNWHSPEEFGKKQSMQVCRHECFKLNGNTLKALSVMFSS